MKLVLALLFLAGIASAEPTKTVFNPFTGKLDFITSLSATISTCTASGLQGAQLTDSASCVWCETVSTLGALVANLLHCPLAAGFILMENGSFILQEDGTKINTEH